MQHIEAQKNIVDRMKSLTGSRSMWDVWSDCIEMGAIAISNAIDRKNFRKREDRYLKIAGNYTRKELETVSEIFANIVLSYELFPDQDLMGTIYMMLGLSSKDKGQFFTPYNVCQMACRVTYNEEDAGKEWFSVLEPAAGGGAMLIAFANMLRNDKNINYQQRVLFVAQELDYITGLICYIQCSLLGMPGYIKIGDTLSNPVTGLDPEGLFPAEKDGDIWYFPMYFSDVWTIRKMRELEKWGRKKTHEDTGCLRGIAGSLFSLSEKGT